MRPHGRARISRNFPMALAICDRCGFQYNHADLHWSFDWQGPRLANQRILVCNTCDDVYFEHNRTILIPADPIPIANPRPEFFVADNNPISPLSFDPLGRRLPLQLGLQSVPPAFQRNAFQRNAFQPSGGPAVSPNPAFQANAFQNNAFQSAGQTIPIISNTPVLAANANLGNMSYGGGIGAAYTGGLQKPSFLAALLNPSTTGKNWIGKNWSSVPGLMPTVLPTVMSGQSAALRYAVSSFTATAPTDQSFLGRVATTLLFSGWDGTVWHTLWTGLSAGTPGETITVTAAQLADTNPYYVHAFGILGDGFNPVAVANLQINANAEGLLSAIVMTPLALS